MVTGDPHSTSGEGAFRLLGTALTLLAVLSPQIIAIEAGNSHHIHQRIDLEAGRSIVAAGQKGEATSARKGKKGLLAPPAEEKSRPARASVKQPPTGTQTNRTSSVLAKNTTPKATKRVEPAPSKTIAETTRRQQAKVEPRVEPKAESKTESRTQPSIELKSESRTQPGTEPYTQPRVEPIAAEDDSDRPPPVLAATDRIEVIEWGSRTNGASGSAASRTSTPSNRSSGRINISTRKIEVEIDPPRVMQIQQALVARGFLVGEPTGVYDEPTIDAMRRFQIAERVDATGYPTAHSLKRLGL